MVRPAYSMPALSTPSIRAAVPPARTTAAYRGCGLMPAVSRGPARGRLGPVVRAAVVQHASGLEPGENRSLLAELTPDDTDLVVFPEAFARDFGKPGSDVSEYAEPLDGPFVTELEQVAKERGTTVVAGMFETSADPARPFNTLVVAGRADRGVPQDPPLRLLRLPRVRPALRRSDRAGPDHESAASRSA